MVGKTSLYEVNLLRILNHIKKSMNTILGYYKYEIKNDITADKIKGQIKPYFEQLLEKRAIQTYKTDVYVTGEDLSDLDKKDLIIEILKRESEDKDKIHVNITIQPVKTIEFVEVKFIL